MNFKPLKPNDPLLLSQKGGSYSPNTLQDRIATMLREWSSIDRASSHSERRTLATNLLHDQGEHLKTVQKVLGQKSAATTTIYQDVTEQEIRQVLKKASKNYLPKVEVVCGNFACTKAAAKVIPTVHICTCTHSIVFMYTDFRAFY